MKFSTNALTLFTLCSSWLAGVATARTTASSSSNIVEDVATLEENVEELIQSIESRVVGGEVVPSDVVDEKYTFMTSWHKGLHDHPACGASLVAANLVLTAAHCMGTSGAVRIGSMLYDKTNLEGKVPGVEAAVIKKYKNPNYTGGTGLFNDYLIIELDRVVDTDLYKPIDLNFDPSLPIEKVTVIGFGKTTEGGDQPDKMKHLTDIPVVPYEECSKMYPNKIHDEVQICAGFVNEGGQDSCVKDSGGPLVTTKEDGTLIQVADVSWGKGCAQPNNPGVYARLSGAKDWLIKTICENKKGAFTPTYCQDDGTTAVSSRSAAVEPVTRKILLASSSFELRDRMTGLNKETDDVMIVKGQTVEKDYKNSHYGKQYLVLKDTITSNEFPRDYAYEGYEISFFYKSSSPLSIVMFYDGTSSETIEIPKSGGGYKYHKVTTTKDIPEGMKNFKFEISTTGGEDASIDDVTVDGILPKNCNKICTSKPSSGLSSTGRTCKDVNANRFNKKCKNADNWKVGNVCQYECFQAGNGYDGDQCCTRL